MGAVRSERPGLIIHLGNRKTGSTSLQGFLSRNEDVLRASKNVNFVRLGRKHISHNQLFRPMRGTGAANIWTRIAEEVSAAPDKTHLMSSELFFDMDIAQQMAAHMPASLRSGLRLVVYLRRQDSYFEAMYKQMTKNGRVRTPPADFVKRLGPELGGYAAILSAFDSVAGQDAIIVRPFERSRLKNGDTIADFFGLLGLEVDDPAFAPPAHAANETLSRAASQLLGALSRNTKMNAREIAREMLRGDDAPPRRSGDVFRLNERREIMERFAEENASVVARYLGGDGSRLFTMTDLSDSAPDPYPDPEEETHLFTEAQDKTAAAIGRIDQRDRAKLFRG